MSGFVNTIELLGDSTVIDSIIEGTIEEFCDDVLDAIGSTAFAYCRRLKYVNLPSVKEIRDDAFSNCDVLKTFILSSENMCVLKSRVFMYSPIASGTGYIYVPRALLSDEDAKKDYRRATNWSTYASQFRALEDYTVDGTVTGELDESKI